ncbi:MAG: DUF3108 domain-containing protein [Gammaproteobacteria bacterium]|nr:DUF3108 domain-containing protein [Gammaproteobacteria bacterium]
MLLLLLARGAAAGELPRAMHAVYEVSSSGNTIAKTTWQLTTETDGSRLFRATTESVGLFKLIKSETVSESSRWQVRDGKLWPTHYTHVRQGGKRDRDIAADYDYQRMQVLHRYGDDRWETPIDGHTLDSLSYLVALARGLNSGQRSFDFNVVEAQKRKVYHFEVAGTESVGTPVATYRTVVVNRIDMRDNRSMTLWCAEALGYLPVKIVHQESEGYELQFLLSELQLR